MFIRNSGNLRYPIDTLRYLYCTAVARNWGIEYYIHSVIRKNSKSGLHHFLYLIVFKVMVALSNEWLVIVVDVNFYSFQFLVNQFFGN